MGNVLSRYYDLNETHTYGHESDDIETPELETGEENPYQEPIADDELTEEDTKYAKFFKGALKKFGVSTPAELGDKKKDFFNYVDKNYAEKRDRLMNLKENYIRYFGNIVEQDDVMDKEVENPETRNKIKVKTLKTRFSTYKEVEKLISNEKEKTKW